MRILPPRMGVRHCPPRPIRRGPRISLLDRWRSRSPREATAAAILPPEQPKTVLSAEEEEEDAEERANNITTTTRIIASTRCDPNSGWEIAMRIRQQHRHDKNAKGLVDRRGRYLLPSPSSAVPNQRRPPVLGRLLLRHCLRTTPVLKTTQPKTKTRLLLYHHPFPPAKLDRSHHSSKQRQNHPSSRHHNPRIPAQRMTPPNPHQPRMQMPRIVHNCLRPVLVLIL